MAAPAFHLLLPLPVLLLASLLLPTAAAAASHNPHGAPATHAHLLHHHGHGHAHHHRSASTMTATARFDTAPSMHQNRIESEENYRQSLRVLDPFFTPAAAQAPSGEEVVAAIGAAATDAERGNDAD